MKWNEISIYFALILSLSGCVTTLTDQEAIKDRLSKFFYAGKNEKLIETYSQYRDQLILDEDTCYLIGWSHQYLGEHEEALEFARRMLELNPSSENGLYLFVLSYRTSVNPEGSMAYIEKIYAENPHFIKGRGLFAMDLDNVGEKRKAYELVREGYLQEPEDDFLAEVYFFFAMQQKPIDEVLEEIDDYTTKYQVENEFWFYIGTGLTRSGHHKLALPYLFNALDKEEDDENIIQQIYETYYSLNDFEEAKQFHFSKLGKYSHHAISWECLAILASLSGEHSEALEYINKAVALDPSDVLAATNKLAILSSLNKPSEAIEFGSKWMKRYPEEVSDPFMNFLGKTYLQSANYEESLNCFLKAHSLNPRDVVSAANVLVAYLMQEDFDDAVQFGEYWLSENGNEPDSNFKDLLDKAKSRRKWGSN